MNDARHSDQVARIDPATSTPVAEVRNVDNESQVDRMIATRELEYTTGGGAPGSPAIPVGGTPQLDRIVARIRESDRPSPFGTGWFPVLPAPPERK